MKNAVALKPAALAAMTAREQREENRVAMWALSPLAVRALVLTFAGVPRARAGDDLTTFNARERASIALFASKLAGDIEIAAQCMRDTDPRLTILH